MTAPTPFDPFIDAIADAVVAKSLPAILAAVNATIPASEQELWDADQVCQHLGIARRTLADREKQAGFPKRIDRPGQPRWLASDIRSYGLGR